MAIQDFKRAAGTLNRSCTTRTYIDFNDAWIESPVFGGVGCAYPFYAYLVSIFAFAPTPEWPQYVVPIAKDIYGALHISRALFPLNSRQPKIMRLICVASQIGVSERSFLNLPQCVFFEMIGFPKSEKWVWGQKDGGNGKGWKVRTESKSSNGVLGRDVWWIYVLRRDLPLKVCLHEVFLK